MQHSHIDSFLRTIQPWAATYTHSTITFVAFRYEGKLAILSARVRLSARLHRDLKSPLIADNLVAAEVPICGDFEAVRALVMAATSESYLMMGPHVLWLLKDKTREYSAFHDSPSAPHRNWSRFTDLDTLSLGGIRRQDLLANRLTELDREVLPHGYRGLGDLMSKWDFSLSSSDAVTIVFAAQPVLRISDQSRLIDRTAEVEIQIPSHLTTDLVTVTFADAASDGHTFRRSIAGRELQWVKANNDRLGKYTAQLPAPSILMCRALYSGALHDESQLFDPAALPNTRRTIVELADPELKRLRIPITNPKTNKDQNAFEAGIAVLLFMLGFDTVRVGGVKQLSDAADIFATTASGRLLIVECTTALLDPKGKLEKLLVRVQEAKDRLRVGSAAFTPECVTGVVIIPKARGELGSVWTTADEHGVIILCRPEIEQALERTRLPPNADAVLDGWLRLRLEEVMTTGLSL
jgi:hypothetical protein